MSHEQLHLVTGASGFIGRVMVQHLVARGIPVRAMVRSAAKVDEVKQLGATEVVVADLTDVAALERAVQGCVGIYHIAGIFRQTNLKDSDFYESNTHGTRRLLDAAIKAGVARVIHCSTSGVHCHISDPPGTEETPYSPGDSYQQSKVEGEKLALEYFRSGRIEGCVIRPAMVYGPTDTRHLKMFRMIASRTFFYVGPSMNVHYVDVRDLVNGFYLAMQHRERNGQVYIIAGERSVSLTVMVNLIADLLNVPRPRLRIPAKPLQWAGSLCEWVCKPFGISPPLYRRRVDFFVNNREFSIEKARRELGYKPALPFEEEVTMVVKWYCSQGWLKSRAKTATQLVVMLLGTLSLGLLTGWVPDDAITYSCEEA